MFKNLLAVTIAFVFERTLNKTTFIRENTILKYFFESVNNYSFEISTVLKSQSVSCEGRKCRSYIYVGNAMSFYWKVSHSWPLCYVAGWLKSKRVVYIYRKWFWTDRCNKRWTSSASGCFINPLKLSLLFIISNLFYKNITYGH